MDHPERSHRRTLLIGLVAVGVVPLTGCMTKPLHPANADGSYCHAIGKWHSRRLTCTTERIPSEQVEADAKRFAPALGKLTVYVVRKRWADTRNAVRITPNLGPEVVTVPESFVRLRLAPGSHTLAADWGEGRTSINFTGAPGEIVFVELVGSVWSWGSSYRLERGDPAESRARAALLRLIADVG